MNTLFLDALFPDPHDSLNPCTSKAEADFTTGNPFALPDLYPPSALGTFTRTSPREANIFDVVDHKDSVKFVPQTAGKEDGRHSIWRVLEVGLKGGVTGGGGAWTGGSLFSLPEEFRSDFSELWGVNHLMVEGGKMGEEVVRESSAEPENGHQDTEVSEEDISEDEVEERSNGEDDFWLDPSVAIPLEKPRYQTWDSFLLRDGNTPTNPYLTEAGSHVFDAVLELHQNDIWSPREAGTVVRGDVFFTCLLHLGLGRSSVLFRYNKAKHTFTPVKEGLRLSGYSVGSLFSVIKLFTQCGKNMRALQRFSSRVYKELSPIPTRVALAECTTTVLTALQTRLSIPASSITSVIHLESLFREPALILQTVFRIILEVKGVKDDAKLLSKLFNIIQQQQFTGGSGWLRPILLELVRRVSRAWLEVVEQWIGLRGTLGMGLEGEWETRKDFFVKVTWEEEVDERGRERKELRYIFDETHVPGFLTNEDAGMVFECGKSLRFLNKFHPGHPLSQPGTVVSQEEMPGLEWKFTWDDLEGIHERVRRYESRLRKAIAIYTETGRNVNTTKTISTLTPPPTANLGTTTSAAAPTPMDKPPTSLDSDIFTKSATELAAILASTSSLMSSPLPPLDLPLHHNPLHHVTMHTHTTSSPSSSDYLTTFAPNLYITPLLSFSQIFTAQSRLVNSACLRMFFVEHGLRHHFDLLYRFLLLGDGMFTSKVSYALFSDDDEEYYHGTERREGEVRAGGRMGLHVSSRESWPPASSELRLALKGLLSEAYWGDGSTGGADTATDPYAGPSSDLPGALSFAIRELSEEEYVTVMDPHKLSALDFLKINYTPPRPLGEVITSTVLYKYDRIFKFLLRLVRMRFVVDQLWRDASRPRPQRRRAGRGGMSKDEMVEMKFRIGARHFVTSFAAYIWEIAIGATWRGFGSRLDEIQAALEVEAGGGSPSGIGALSLCLSLAGLTATHGKVLDRMMFLAFLRRRQQPVMNVIEEILGLVLEFAKGVEGEERIVDEMYYRFRRKVKMFGDVVRGLSESRGYGDRRVGVGGEHAGLGAKTNSGVGAGEGAVFANLLVRLEMTDFWK
ncbi:Spc98 family-domain-containing protein [Tirmania nivea]|nr:Spc98 family-domain-containing protein [Tirmania nivea]